jgi:hypothetical protein
MFLSTVFVGTATKVNSQPNGNTTTTFEVSEVLHSKKALGKTVDVHHTAIGAMCGLTFDKGKTYVVYAGGEEQLSAGACSRTHLLKKGDEDVAFAHEKAKREKAFIDGTVVMLDAGPHAGVKVRASGTEISAISDAKGKFRLLVPPGDYSIEVLSEGLRTWRGEPMKVSLPEPGACAIPVVSVTWDGRIEGKLTDKSGKPVAGLEVFANAVKEADRHWRLSGKTDAEGKYLIHEVPAGTFKVGVSLKDFGGVSPASPYPETWYPGEVRLERAGLKSGVDFVVPVALPLSKIRGTVKRKDGSIPKGIYVSVVPEGGLRSTSGPTDEKGEFSFDELSGTEVVIRACEYAPKQQCAEEKRKLSGDVNVPLVIPQ